MSANASALIVLLEKEIKSLRRLIAEAIKEQDFKHADAHQKALNKAQYKLEIIRELEDKNHRERKFKRLLLDSRKRHLNGRYTDAYSRRIKAEFEELERLEQRAPVPVPESNVLATQLESVLTGSVKGIDVVLRSKDDLRFQIRRRKNAIKMALPNVLKLLKAHVLWNSDLDVLKVRGFVQVSEDRLEMEFNRGEDTHRRIMSLLSVIVLERFLDREIAGQSYVEVIR